MTLKYDQDTIAEIRGYNGHQLANIADSYADNDEAKSFFWSIRDSVLEAAHYFAAEDWNRQMVEDYSGDAAEIADNAPSVYTWAKWQQFVGTSAFREDPTELGFNGSDMGEGAGICLYIIAQRLVYALAQEIQESITDDDTEV